MPHIHSHSAPPRSVRGNVGPLRRLARTLTDSTTAYTIEGADSLAEDPAIQDWANGKGCTPNNGLLKCLSGIGVGADGSEFTVLVMGWKQVVPAYAPATPTVVTQWTQIPLLEVKFTLGSKVGIENGLVTDAESYARRVDVLTDYIDGKYSVRPNASAAGSGGPASILFDPGDVPIIQYFVRCNSPTGGAAAAEAGLLEADITRE